jgi:hypothetical protein
VDRPVAVACINTALSPVALSGYVAVECPKTPPPEVPKAQEAPVLAVVAGVAAAAGLSHLASNRREWLALPLLPIVARIKQTADDPREAGDRADHREDGGRHAFADNQGHRQGVGRRAVASLRAGAEGRVKSVRIGPFTYYFVNPRAAADVIPASVNPDSLSLEDREKLDLLALGA